MKAATIQSYDADVKITDVPRPKLENDTVIVEVNAASLNPIDSILRSGHMKDMLPISFPYVMGYDVSGVVVEVGHDVKNVKVGDAVFARPNQTDAGSLAEFARIKASELAVKPDSISHLQAASVPLVGLTAWQALFDKAHLKAGQKVLIHAGSGGVGTLAIQLAKQAGAYVATTVSPRNADLVRDLGADLVIDYHSQKFEDEVAGYDVVFDMLGGDVMNRSFAVLKKGGCLVSIKGQDSDGNADKHGVRFESFFMSPNGDQLAKLAALMDHRKLKPVIGETFAFADVGAAYAEMDDGHAPGKIVVSVP